MEDSMVYKAWFAKVRFCRDHIVRDISVKKIKSDGRHIRPAGLEDFDVNNLYAVKTAEFDPEGRDRWYYAHVGRLAENKEALCSTKRISWPATCPRHCPRDEDPPSTSSEETGAYNCTSALEALAKQRAKKVEKASRKRVAEDEAMHLFVNNTAVASPPLPRLSPSLSEEQFLPEEMVKRMLDEREDHLERRMKAVVEECVSSLLEKHFSKLEDMISSLIQSRGSEAGGELCSSGVLTAQNSIPHKIHIGYGVQMDQKHYESMMGAKQKSDWATCLIQGVFGPEGKKMRQYPRTESLKAFICLPEPDIFLCGYIKRKEASFSSNTFQMLHLVP